MSLLARKINRNNWNLEATTVSDLSADAITQCMKTIDNSMSTYEIASEAEIDQAFLAIAANFSELETFDILLLDKQCIIDKGLTCEQNSGNTPVQNLVNTHWDIINLNYGNLGTCAWYMLERFKLQKVVRRTKLELKQIIKKAINDNILDPQPN